MTNSFSNILIPVDFSINTEVAVKKAVALAGQKKPAIHLLHIYYPPLSIVGGIAQRILFTPSIQRGNIGTGIAIKMAVIREAVEKALPGSNVFTYIKGAADVQQEIIRFSQGIKPELIIIGETKNHPWFPFLKTVNPDIIARETNFPVLTAKPGSMIRKISSVIIPIRSFLPQRKIALLSALARKNKPLIHLVTPSDNSKAYTNTNVFIDTYRTITQQFQYPVRHKELRDNNFARGIFNYARGVNADLILANPYTETRVSALFNKHICDLIVPTSGLTVMTARPFDI